VSVRTGDSAVVLLNEAELVLEPAILVADHAYVKPEVPANVVLRLAVPGHVEFVELVMAAEEISGMLLNIRAKSV
jgi:hypothetical protein